MCQYGFGAKLCNLVFFPNGLMMNRFFFHIWRNVEIIIWCNSDMVKLSNVFLGHISINGEMVKRLNAICTFE